MNIAQLTFSCHFSPDSSSPESLSQAPNLLQEYRSCLAARKYDEANEKNKEINYLITNEINATGGDLWRFAEDLLRKAVCFKESIPVYFAAASMFKKKGNLVIMSLCVGDDGIHGANEKMIVRDVAMKEVVKHHVIPLMRDVKKQILEMTSVSEKDKCEWVGHVLKCIAKSEKLVDDDETAEETMKESKVWEGRWRTEKKANHGGRR